LCMKARSFLLKDSALAPSPLDKRRRVHSQ
jgi:hypothetical protein